MQRIVAILIVLGMGPIRINNDEGQAVKAGFKAMIDAFAGG